MGTFQITSPGGKQYRVEGENAEGAHAALTQMLGGATPSEPKPQMGLGDTWPARLAKSVYSAVTLPGDVYSGKAEVPSSDNGGANIDRVTDLAGLGSPVNPGIMAGDRAIPGIANNLVKQKPKVPTTQELATTGGNDISAAKDSGLDVTASSVGAHSQKLQRELFDAGIHPVDAPNTFTKLKELENAPPDAIFTAANLQSLRESLGHTAQNFNQNGAKDQLAASRAIRGLDQFLPSIDAKDVVAGTPAATQQLFERGRANYAPAMRSNDLNGSLDKATTGILERAQGRAQAANSGKNLDNTIRQKVEALLEKPKEVSGFSDAELSALNSVVQGGPVRNAARYVGHLLGGGGGIGQSLIAGAGGAGGFAAGGPIGAALGSAAPVAVGSAAKALANALAKRSLNKADELVRTNSPLYRELLSKAPNVPKNQGRNEAFAKALLMTGAPTQQ